MFLEHNQSYIRTNLILQFDCLTPRHMRRIMTFELQRLGSSPGWRVKDDEGRRTIKRRTTINIRKTLSIDRPQNNSLTFSSWTPLPELFPYTGAPRFKNRVRSFTHALLMGVPKQNAHARSTSRLTPVSSIHSRYV